MKEHVQNAIEMMCMTDFHDAAWACMAKRHACDLPNVMQIVHAMVDLPVHTADVERDSS